MLKSSTSTSECLDEIIQSMVSFKQISSDFTMIVVPELLMFKEVKTGNVSKGRTEW